MRNIEFWPGLEQAWAAASGPSASGSPVMAEGGQWRLIKAEPRSLVLWFEAESCTPAVLKIYRTPPRLAWRTFSLASRANREFTVMMQAHRQGLPVVRPRYWLEQRERGCLAFSALVLDAVDGPDLESWLQDHPDDKAPRRAVAQACGRLLGRFHRAGLFWGTVTPRNLLLPGGRGDDMCAIDMPYARFHGHDISGDDHAMADLGCALLMSDGQLAFDDDERSALIEAYCDGDAERARAFNGNLRLLTHREWKRQRFLRRLSNLFSKGARSQGRGGMYESGTSGYTRLASESVFLPCPGD